MRLCSSCRPADRVKVISFDDKVRDLNEFTNNRETLRAAIKGTGRARERRFTTRSSWR